MYMMLVTNRRDALREVVNTVIDGLGCECVTAGSAETTLHMVAETTPDLMILDEAVDGMPGIHIAREVVMKNPMVNIALVSSLPEAAFHDRTEGLGILARLPLQPKAADARKLVEKVRQLLPAA